MGNWTYLVLIQDASSVMSEMVISSLVGVEQAFLLPTDFSGVFLSLPLAEVTAVLPGLAAAGLLTVEAAGLGLGIFGGNLDVRLRRAEGRLGLGAPLEARLEFFLFSPPTSTESDALSRMYPSGLQGQIDITRV